MERGQALGITPYGTEAMHVLRAEKGYIIVGQETDGTVTPDDLGLGGLVGKVEARLRRQAVAARGRISSSPRRKQLVGLLTEDAADGAGGGRADRRRSGPAECRCTCSATSPRATGAPPAAARSRWRSSRPGRSHDRPKSSTRRRPAGFAEVRVCAPVFFDRQGRARAWLRPCRSIPRRPRARRDRGELAAGVAARRASPSGCWRRARASRCGSIRRCCPQAEGCAASRWTWPINRCHGVGGRTAMRLGPDEWLLVGPEERGGRIAARRGSGACRAASLARRRQPRPRRVRCVGRGGGAMRSTAAARSTCRRPRSPPGRRRARCSASAEVILARTDDRCRPSRSNAAAPLRAYVRDFLLEAAREFNARA